MLNSRSTRSFLTSLFRPSTTLASTLQCTRYHLRAIGTERLIAVLDWRASDRLHLTTMVRQIKCDKPLVKVNCTLGEGWTALLTVQKPAPCG